MAEAPDRPPDSISITSLNAFQLIAIGFWLAIGAMLAFALVYSAWHVLDKGIRLLAGLS